jgi:hypothetical protein
MNDATAADEGMTKPVTLPLLTNVDTAAGYVQPRISWPRETTAPALEPAWAGEFRSFDDWVSFASKRLTDAGRTDTTYATDIPAVCIDAKGRRCTNGGHFMKARDEDAFPVRFFWDMRPTTDCLCPEHGRWLHADSIYQMVRELDVAMNGTGAARQASLCDIFGQLIDCITAANTVRE